MTNLGMIRCRAHGERDQSEKESAEPWMKAAARRFSAGDDRGPFWPAEPLLGGWYTEEEVEAATKAIRDSMDPTTVGFGFICPGDPGIRRRVCQILRGG